jgi:ABC-type branched-subunit amino acid transport system permease subunit
VVLAVICVAVAGLVPQFAGPKLLLFTNAAVLVPMFLSLAMLVRLSGQLSLCHAAFVAIGASTMGHLAGSAGVPWFLALLLAGLAVVPIGAIVAMPAIRLSGVYLALATFGFGILVEQLLFGQAVMFGAIGLRHAPRPTIARSDDAYYLLVLAIAVATCLLVYAVTKSRLGRLLRALGDSAVVLRVSGVDTNSTRVMVFCLSAFLAGITGALTIAALGQAGGRTFGYVNSLLWLTVLVVSGPKVVSGAVAAALGLAVVPSYFPQSLLPHLPVVFGAIAIAVTALDGATVKGRIPALDRARRSPVRARLSLPAPIGAPRRTSA